MPGLDEHLKQPVKLLFMGDPGAGKTGALNSLVGAGYKLRVYDFDNLLGSLFQYVKQENLDKIANVKYQTFTDKMKMPDTPAVMIGNRMEVYSFAQGTPDAYVRALKQLEYWKEGADDLGRPGTWGTDTIVVIDSLTSAAQSAYRYCKALNPLAKEGQTHYFNAQQLIMNLLYLLGSDNFSVNVIVIAHIDYTKNHLDVTKGFPRSIGSAINSQIASVFNAVLLAESVGSGAQVKRTIRTNSTGIVDLKNPVAFKLPDSLPLASGLADFFRAVNEP